MLEITDPRLVFMKEEDVLSASGFCQILKDRWFVVHKETKELVFFQLESRRRGKFSGASPQCNSNEAIAISLRDRLFPWADIKFFERVVYTVDPKDYC